VKISKLFINFALAGLFIGNSISACAQQNNTSNSIDKKQIENTIHDYILQNPDVLVQSLQAYQQKQMEQTQKTFQKIQEMAPKYSKQIFHQAVDPIAGNTNGTVTLVEFADYQCPHCIDMTQIVDNLIKKNPNLRVVFKEFPIRGPMSETAAKAALASAKQGKYYEFHTALMNSKIEPLTENTIYDIAKSVGLDVNKLKKDMKDNSVSQQIKDTYKLAQDLQLIYTPVFFVAKSNINPSSGADAVIFIPGGVSEDQLNTAISKMAS